jgi:TonB family protein
MKYIGMIFGLMLLTLIIKTCVEVQTEQPEVVVEVPVVYPPLALAQRVEGTVNVEITVGKDGWVVAAMIVRTDNNLLSDAALDAAVQYRFKPMHKECRVVLPFVFKLKN